MLGTADNLTDTSYIFWCMDTSYQCRPELIVASSRADDIHTSLVRSHIFLHSDDGAVFLPGMLDIHSNIVNEFMLYEVLEHVWILTVGIELDSEAKVTNLLSETRKITMDSWLSSTDRYAIKESYSSSEEFEKTLLGMYVSLESLNLFWQDELRVVAEVTTHIASECKNHTCHMSWIVYEGELVESRY